MNTLIAQSRTTHLNREIANPWTKFISWTKGQEENRFLWLALGIFGHGCVLTIFTMLVIMFTGNNFIFWPFAIAAMTMTVVVNLAAMPTKITIPVFFFSVLIDLTLVVLALLQFLN